jgi:hypothetical protein
LRSWPSHDSNCGAPRRPQPKGRKVGAAMSLDQLLGPPTVRWRPATSSHPETQSALAASISNGETACSRVAMALGG